MLMSCCCEQRGDRDFWRSLLYCCALPGGILLKAGFGVFYDEEQLVATVQYQAVVRELKGFARVVGVCFLVTSMRQLMLKIRKIVHSRSQID
jgi:hypothetical protein